MPRKIPAHHRGPRAAQKKPPVGWSDLEWRVEKLAMQLAQEAGRSWDRLPYLDRERFRRVARARAA